MLVHVGADGQQRALALAARLGVTPIGSQRLAFLDSTIFHFRLGDGGRLNDIISAFENEGIGFAQPNYLFALQDDAVVDQRQPASDVPQYVVAKLRLTEAHRMAVGTGVTVAVIDSPIDAAHPELRGSIVNANEALGQPDEHGTGMAGAIAAHGKLLGVAPQARILAIRAFATNVHAPRTATTRDIIGGINRAISSGARIINMSFAGPYDPALQVALRKAHDKGVLLIAAAGNLGPTSPPLYPAADENVLAVTAVDHNDALLPVANRGPHIALAAPGVDVLEATPRARYAFDTGTSIAAAHVSGAAALLLQRDPEMDVATLEAILISTARHLGQSGRNSEFGSGLVDPYRALSTVAAKLAARGVAPASAASKRLLAPGI
jgi:subtilisin family serine protease